MLLIVLNFKHVCQIPYLLQTKTTQAWVHSGVALYVQVGVPQETLVNPTGTGPVPFVIRRHAPGVCGVKLSEQHQQTGTGHAPNCHAVPSLQDMARAVHISSLIDRPKPGDLSPDLRPVINCPHTSGIGGSVSLS